MCKENNFPCPEYKRLCEDKCNGFMPIVEGKCICETLKVLFGRHEEIFEYYNSAVSFVDMLIKENIETLRKFDNKDFGNNSIEEKKKLCKHINDYHRYKNYVNVLSDNGKDFNRRYVPNELYEFNKAYVGICNLKQFLEEE